MPQTICWWRLKGMHAAPISTLVQLKAGHDNILHAFVIHEYVYSGLPKSINLQLAEPRRTAHAPPSILRLPKYRLLRQTTIFHEQALSRECTRTKKTLNPTLVPPPTAGGSPNASRKRTGENRRRPTCWPRLHPTLSESSAQSANLRPKEQEVLR